MSPNLILRPDLPHIEHRYRKRVAQKKRGNHLNRSTDRIVEGFRSGQCPHLWQGLTNELPDVTWGLSP